MPAILCSNVVHCVKCLETLLKWKNVADQRFHIDKTPVDQRDRIFKAIGGVTPGA
jgi:hypothetical protein